MILRAELALARLVRAVSRRLGRGGGTTAPGRLLLRLEPRALERLGARLSDGAVVISATNGKTTTAGMVAGVMQRTGRDVVHNRAGSNMHWGVATALLDVRGSGSELGLFEVDEAWLAPVARALDARLFVLSNLFRDQLDRYGELDLVADRWAEVVAEREGRSRFVLCADDPLVADLGRGRRGVSWFGVADDSQALGELQHAADSKRCRNCGANYEYEAVYLGHLGRYRCPRCGRERPAPEVEARRVVLRGMDGSDVEISTPQGALQVRLPLPGLYNVYNALAATAAALAPGAPLNRIKEGLEQMAAVFGRVERIAIAGRELAILLVKNPTGANEVLRTLELERGPLDLWIALNDGIADGRDVSWIWDADFELLSGRVRRVTCSGTRAEEMALRLKYAGVEAPIEVDRDLGRSLDSALGAADGAGLFALPTYTALLELRGILSARGVAPAVVGVSARSASSRARRDAEAVVWHDVECAGYAVDLPLWRELAAELGGPVLELGAGTGRVALDLAAYGHRLWALDSDPVLVEELRRRAWERGLAVRSIAGDARAFDLGRRFGLAIAPMQVVQLLGGPAGRAQMLTAVRRHLDPGGVLAMAIADPLEGVPSADPFPPLPDVREANGWVHSSRPVAVREESGEIVIERVREAVSPRGERSASAATIRLERTDPGDLARTSTELGFRARGPRRVAATDDYVGSTIVLVEAV